MAEGTITYDDAHYAKAIVDYLVKDTALYRPIKALDKETDYVLRTEQDYNIFTAQCCFQIDQEQLVSNVATALGRRIP